MYKVGTDSKLCIDDAAANAIACTCDSGTYRDRSTWSPGSPNSRQREYLAFYFSLLNFFVYLAEGGSLNRRPVFLSKSIQGVDLPAGGGIHNLSCSLAHNSP